MKTVTLRRLLRTLDRTNRPDLPVLSVYRDYGVVPKDSRSDNFNKTPEDVSRYLHVQPGNLVVNKMKAWSGSVAVSCFEGIVSGDYLVCSVAQQVESKYLHHLLRSSRFVGEMKLRSVGIRPNQERLYWEGLADIGVPLPPQQEQRRIAEFLDDRIARIDLLITARREQIALFEALLMESIRLGVGGVLGPDDRGVPSPVPWLRVMAPEARVARLAHVLTLQRGVDLTADEQRGGHVPVITTSGVVGMHDVAIAKGPGVVLGRYGSVGSVHWVDEDYWPHNTTLYVRDAHGNNMRWAYYLLRSFPFEAMQARAAVPGVNRNDMATEQVPVIPPSLQARAVASLDTLVEEASTRGRAVARSVDLLTEYKQSLITAAVSGEFDVTTVGSGIPG